MPVESLPLPPGSTGWPLVGEGLKLGSNSFAFMGERVAKYGAVARSRLMTQDLAILAGPEAADAFLNEDNVRRAGGLPPHAADLFGSGVVNQVDGDIHRRRKAHVMRALDARALEHYLPEIRTLIRARIGDWVANGEVSMQDRCVSLCLELVLASFTGLHPDENELAYFADGMSDFARALFGVPLALPGTPLSRARVFAREMRARFAELTETRRATATGDGISRLIASEVDGERLATDDIAKEVLHLTFAASSMWAWFAFGTQVLAQNQSLTRRLRAAVGALSRDPSGRELLELTELNAFVREVKRLGLIIPITALGVAKRDFEVAGYRVPKGWLVVWTTYGSHRSASVAPYASPEAFDIDRYARGEGTGRNHFAPQGPGEPLTSHRCGGVEYSTLALSQFFLEMLRAPAVSLLPQDLTMDMSRLPANWKEGLRARFG